MMEYDFGAEMVKLPKKNGVSKNNAIQDIVNNNSLTHNYVEDIEDFEETYEESSRNRWYEYYKGIGYTHDKLVDMGLTQPSDVGDFNVKEAMT